MVSIVAPSIFLSFATGGYTMLSLWKAYPPRFTRKKLMAGMGLILFELWFLFQKAKKKTNQFEVQTLNSSFQPDFSIFRADPQDQHPEFNLPRPRFASADAATAMWGPSFEAITTFPGPTTTSRPTRKISRRLVDNDTPYALCQP